MNDDDTVEDTEAEDVEAEDTEETPPVQWVVVHDPEDDL